MPETWTHHHEMPMRWADLDILNHVTNVVYLDYAAEAQAVLRRDGVLPEAPTVHDITVTYLRPTPLSSRPLLIRSRREEDRLVQEICTTADEEPAVHARVVTTYGSPSVPEIPHLDGEPVEARVRISDLDATGAVSLIGQFRVAQEARVLHFGTRMKRHVLGQFVVGTISLQSVAPLAWRTEPYAAHSWISRVGRSSFTINTLVGDRAAPVFVNRTSLVGFDSQTQTARPFTGDELTLLHEHLRT